MPKIKFFRLRVTLQYWDNPPVWREVIVPGTYTFDDLHGVIQIAFGWSDYHLYEFSDAPQEFGNQTFRIAVPDPMDAELDVKTYNSRRKKLNSIFPKKMDRLFYSYDFGDSWTFAVDLVEAISLDGDYPPTCADGGGATPPEDCGGTAGYGLMLNKLAAGGEEAEFYRCWLGLADGEDWDPEFFSTQLKRYINLALAYFDNDHARRSCF